MSYTACNVLYRTDHFRCLTHDLERYLAPPSIAVADGPGGNLVETWNSPSLLCTFARMALQDAMGAIRFDRANAVALRSSGQIRGRNIVPQPAAIDIANDVQGRLQVLRMRKNMSKKRGNSEGSIYRMQDGRWRAAVTVGKDANGKPKRKVFTAATRHEVKDQLNDALRDLKLGIPLVSEKQTVARFLTHWLDQVVKPRVRPKTLRTYSDLVQLHLAPGIGEVPLGKLYPQRIREFLNGRLEFGLSPRTVKHLLVTLRGALSVAVKDGQIPRNTAALVDPPRVPRYEAQVFKPEQARAFLDAVQGSRLESAYTAAVAVGMRQGEILGLRWPDLDLEAGKLLIRAALQRVDKKLTQVEPKSTGSRRTIHLPAVCLASFARHKADQDLERKWAGSRWQETGYVFTTRIGTALDARDLLRDYYAITRPKAKKGEQPRKLPFPAIRFHDLRHSAATLLLAQGVSPRYITELLGHSQVSFTLQTYAHVLPEVQKQTAHKMDEILQPKENSHNRQGAAKNGVATRVATKTVSALVF